MAWSVDQVEEVGFSVFSLIIQTDRMGFDGNPAFPFQVHRIKQLSLHISFSNQAGSLKETIGKRSLAMIDMGDDTEVASELRVHGKRERRNSTLKHWSIQQRRGDSRRPESGRLG